MRLHACPQRSPEWHQLRAGKLTGSCAKDVLATVKTGEAAARRDLRLRIVAERLTGRPQDDSYVNAVMQWGIDHEAEAIAAYEAATGALVTPVGFCEHDELEAGTSPDGFVGDDGLISVKCPKTATHIRYLCEGVEPAEHAAQNSHELWITGRKWIDFVSYDPRLPQPMQLFITRVTRSDLWRYESEAKMFLIQCDREVEKLRALFDLTRTLEECVDAV